MFMFIITGIVKLVWVWTWLVTAAIIIDRVALAKQGDNGIGSVRLFVYLFVSVRSPGWTVWPMILIFSMWVDLDLG